MYYRAPLLVTQLGRVLGTLCTSIEEWDKLRVAKGELGQALSSHAPSYPSVWAPRAKYGNSSLFHLIGNSAQT